VNGGVRTREADTSLGAKRWALAHARTPHCAESYSLRQGSAQSVKIAHRASSSGSANSSRVAREVFTNDRSQIFVLR